MRKYPKRRKDPPAKTTGSMGFSYGLNQLTHPSTIRNDELAEALNVFYSQNGVLSKRPGSLNLGDIRGTSTIINALNGVYNIGGNDYLLRISDDGILQSYDFTDEEWEDVADSPTFTDTDSQILQAYGHVYILNQTDDMVKWDGTTFSTFTPIANPDTAPTVTKSGSGTGSVTYYYRYVWYNDVGNTLASDADDLANMPEELDASTYAIVTLPEAPEGAVRTGIFRGTTAGDEAYLASVPASQTVYNDKGYDEIDPLYAVPTAETSSNTTGGLHFKFATVYNDTLIGITTEEGDDTLVFSAGGDKFDSFGRADGGGYYAWRKDDGDPITGVHAFQEELYVFKSRKIGAFAFDENGGAVRDINLALGAVSHRSIHAAGNDLRFWSRDGAFSLGNEPNFADIIRTKILSARADTLVSSMTAAEFDKICGVFYKDHSLWGIPLGGTDEGNTSCIAYNEKYAAWSEWFGLTPGVWCKFIDSDNKERLFYGDSQSGNVVECWTGTDDNGTAISWRVATKQFNMNKPHRYKTFYRVYFVFGSVTGTGTQVTLVEDGERSQISMPLYANVGDQGFGVDQWGTMEFGDSSGEYTGDVSGMIVRYADVNKDLLSLQAVLTNDGNSDQVEFMGIYFEYADSAQPLPSTMQLQRAYT
jgi:hypothetical protein